MVKHIPNFITSLRIIGSLFLLSVTTFLFPFFLIYGACCASDILDGYLARRLCCESAKGQVLDSAADFLFITVLLYLFITYNTIPIWGFIWALVIAIVRISSLVVGFIKYHAFSFLHTYANKMTGLLLACFPILYYLLGREAMLVILCTVATLSAIEECIIVILSKALDRNIKSIFAK